VVDKVLL